MVSQNSLLVAQAAKEIYEIQLRSVLEASYWNQFVAIEPVSDQHFVGSSLSQAIQSARAAFPDRISFAMRVGHESAVHLGGLS